MTQAYKFNAIKELLDRQAHLHGFPGKKFLMFLTIRCNYYEQNQHDFPATLPQAFQGYVDTVRAMPRTARKAPYILKAFVFENLTRFFTANNFLPEFLPVIHYSGDGNHPMLFFSVIGTQVANQAGIPASLQVPAEFLKGKFISVEKAGNFINNQTLVAHNEVDWDTTDSLSLFQNTETFQQHWQL